MRVMVVHEVLIARFTSATARRTRMGVAVTRKEEIAPGGVIVITPQGYARAGFLLMAKLVKYKCLLR